MDPDEMAMAAETLRLLLRVVQHTRHTVQSFETDLERLSVLLNHLLSLLDPE